MNGVYNGGAGGSHHEPDPALYAWTEVTGSFLASCQELQLGELLHDDMFGLFEVGYFPSVVDPDPAMNWLSWKPYWEFGQKLTNKANFQPFKKAFVPS
jgi:hypothetical protein